MHREFLNKNKLIIYITCGMDAACENSNAEKKIFPHFLMSYRNPKKNYAR